MKNHIQILFIALLQTFQSYAQIDAELPGVVVEQNSKFNTGAIIYLANAKIKSPGAASELLSESNGSFKLQYADMPPGKKVRVYVSKNDYELVNEEELKRAAVTDRLDTLKVVMCKEGQLYETKWPITKLQKMPR